MNITFELDTATEAPDLPALFATLPEGMTAKVVSPAGPAGGWPLVEYTIPADQVDAFIEWFDGPGVDGSTDTRYFIVEQTGGVLTEDLKAQMEDALLADLRDEASTTRAGSAAYLADLLETPVGTPLARTQLGDVVDYFGLEA